MNVSEVCIKRPVFTVVLSLVLILFGILSFQQLPLRSQPKVFRPRIAIQIRLPGSSAEYVEENVTTPIENALQSIPDVTYMESHSRQGISVSILHFKNISQQEFITAQSAVTQAVGRVNLPESAAAPMISAGGREGAQLMFVAISSATMGQRSLVDYVANSVVKPLQQISGVGLVDQFSSRNGVRVNLLPRRLAQFHLSPLDVVNALKANDIAMPVGNLVNSRQSIALNLLAKPKDLTAFRHIVVAHHLGREIDLQDVAKVEIDSTTFGGAFTFVNGKQGVAVNIIGADNGNPIKTGKILRNRIHLLQDQLPPGTKVSIIWDATKLLQRSVHELSLTIFEAILMVALVTFLFLGNLRFTLIPIVTIPVCIVSAAAVMFLLGFSINLMTLLAMVIAVGLVVDDAIVVLENAHRHIELGEPPFQAALSSMREVTFPIIGMTLSIIAVYLPTAFMRGKAAIYFQQFAFTLAGAVLISGFVALTLTPMMCARISLAEKKGRYNKLVEGVFVTLQSGYERLLKKILSLRWLVVVIFFALFGSGYFLVRALPSSLMPNNYVGFVFTGLSTTINSSNALLKQVDLRLIKVVKSMPEVDAIISFGGGGGFSNGFAVNFIRLKPQYSAAKPTLVFSAKLQNKLQKNITGGKAFVSAQNLNDNSSNNNSGSGSVEFYVQGYADYDVLLKAVRHLARNLQQTGLFSSVQNDMQYSSIQYNLTINRQMANQLNVPIQNINSALSIDFGSYVLQDGYSFNGVLYPVIVQLPMDRVADLRVLNQLFVKNSANHLIALSRLISAKITTSLPMRTHINGVRSGTLTVVSKPGVDPGKVLSTIRAEAKSSLPEGVTVSFSQRMLDMIKGNTTALMIFSLGIVFIYLVFSALFESFVDPLIILFTVPLCIVGALLVLYLIGGSLNLYTEIALVTLVGLVSKHGVLITHFANGAIAEGKSVSDAVVQAATIRLRPILMTTATMIIGALPLVLSSGVGSNGRIQVGSVIISGLVSGTFFSLIVIPVMYTLLVGLKRSRT
jgi:multidrug efflux pump